jgi:hypothetical protein
MSFVAACLHDNAPFGAVLLRFKEEEGLHFTSLLFHSRAAALKAKFSQQL